MASSVEPDPDPSKDFGEIPIKLGGPLNRPSLREATDTVTALGRDMALKATILLGAHHLPVENVAQLRSELKTLEDRYAAAVQDVKRAIHEANSTFGSVQRRERAAAIRVESDTPAP